MTSVNINKDTTLCISLAAKPSNFGTRFHNHLYQALDLNFIYKAFTTPNIEQAIQGIRGLNIRGCGVSMPYKEACIPLLDELDPSAKAIDSVNTIVNTDGHLKAYNTDYIAIFKLLKKHNIANDTQVVLKGSGGMAKAVACALRDLGFNNGIIVARNKAKGQALADLCNFKWQQSLDDTQAKLLINATPVGMTGTPTEFDCSFTDSQIEAADTLFEVVAMPAITPAVKAALAHHKEVIYGSDVFAIQAVEQFKLYTGVTPTDAQFKAAAEYSRS